ncbi:hypothetical protein LTS17_011538 [Exophiala oligosperma]
MGEARKDGPVLPSIASLIEAVSAGNEKGKDKLPSPIFDHPPRRVSSSSQGYNTSPERQAISESPRRPPLPTPELPPASSFDFSRPSPMSYSPKDAPGRNHHYSSGPASTNPELYTQRPPHYPPMAVDTHPPPYPPIAEGNQWTSSTRPPPHDPMHLDGHARAPAPTAFRDPATEAALYNNHPQQMPLPTNFPPPVPVPGPSLPPLDAQMGPVWRHHHYYPPGNPPPFPPQPQERYICPTCSKPFSRPSSLKIHTHSHTGEKPYTCTYAGCGKSFSVRSNMKRHEKGHRTPEHTPF